MARTRRVPLVLCNGILSIMQEEDHVGARAIVQKSLHSVEKPKVFHPGKRGGATTHAEQSIVAQFVADQTKEVTETQVAALSRLMRRSKDVIRKLIEKAREDFQESAGFYVSAHKQAVAAALANGDAKSLDAGIKGAQWAIENVSAEGVRIVDKKAAEGPTGPRIMVNIAMGGMNKQTEPVEATVAEVVGDPQDPPKSESL